MDENTSYATEPATTNSDEIRLRVGGRIFTTLKATLLESRFFEILLGDRWDKGTQDEALFIDADPDLFEHILNYLRRGVFPLFYDAQKGFDYARYTALLGEARYFGISRLERWISQKKFLEAMRVVHIAEEYDEPPSRASYPAGTTITHCTASWSKREVYVCPRDIEVHRGHPEKCGRRCHQERGDAPEKYETEDYVRVFLVRQEVVFYPEACMSRSIGAFNYSF
ncbi:hypothetical protein VTJ04DRAFT_3951 [Mycothermus thermophilus]|uniref:uncharacterized protein n=1 Tax=Humicola insolens TaxID=85995 RepID=UPI003743B1FC